MSELTKEYLDKKLDKLATKEDIKDVKDLIESEVGNLARITEDRFEEIKKELDVRKEVDQLKIQMSKVWSALNIKN